MEYGCSKTVFEYLSMDAVAECTACCPPHRLIMIHGRNGAAEKLDQNIPIDRKGTGTHWQLRSVVLHTFVFVFVFVCFDGGRKEDRMLRIDVQGRGG